MREGEGMSDLTIAMIAIGFFPLVVLCVALTGPHSKYERDDSGRRP